MQKQDFFSEEITIPQKSWDINVSAKQVDSPLLEDQNSSSNSEETYQTQYNEYTETLSSRNGKKEQIKLICTQLIKILIQTNPLLRKNPKLSRYLFKAKRYPQAILLIQIAIEQKNIQYIQTLWKSAEQYIKKKQKKKMNDIQFANLLFYLTKIRKMLKEKDSEQIFDIMWKDSIQKNKKNQCRAKILVLRKQFRRLIENNQRQ